MLYGNFKVVTVMNDEMFRLSLIELMNEDLLNDFFNMIFKFHIKDGEYIYMQYKIVNNNIVMNVFDNGKKRRFKAYIFCLNDIGKSDKNVICVNVNSSYEKYKNGSINKLYLLGALLKAKSLEERKEIINLLADNKIKNILLEHFTL